MARIRTVKPEFWTDSKTGTLSGSGTKLFLGMLNHCDDYGVIEYDLPMLKAKIFPYEDGASINVVGNPLIQELLPKGLVVVFTWAEDGSDDDQNRPYLLIRNFQKHQKVDKPGKPTIKGFSMAELEKNLKESKVNPNPRESSRTFAKNSSGREGKGREGSGKEGNLAAVPQQAVDSIPEPKELTPLQMVIRGFKEAKGIDADNKDWDRKFFARQTRPAKELLVAFDGDALAAIAYILAKSVEWEHLSDWGLEAVVKAAGREYNRIGGENGRKDKPVEPIGLDGSTGHRRLASSGSLVGDAMRGLEHAAISPEGNGDMGGPDDDFSGD